MEPDDDFDKMMQHAILYGTGVLVMQMDEKMQFSTRVVPIEEYTEVGEQLQWIQQNTKANDDEGCPRRYHAVKVLKQFPFTDTQATLYGKELHSAAEFYIKDNTPLPPQFEFVKDMLDALKAKPGRKLCEHEMGVTADLRPCGFMDKDVWVRGIADLLIIDDDNLTARVVDYKTGNNNYRERVARIEKAHETGVWNPKPTPLCGWCVVKTCEHNRKRD
jgi:hypothetical protein